MDPRQSGGLQTGKGGHELVRLVMIDGEEVLFYPSLPIDVAVIRGTTADEHGNISMENVSRFGDAIGGPGGFINISRGTRRVVFLENLRPRGSRQNWTAMVVSVLNARAR